MFKYIAGNTRHKLLKQTTKLLELNKFPIVNYILENSKDNKNKVFNEYIKLLDNIDNNYKIALKLSSLDFDIDLTARLIENYKLKNISIIIDAEDNINNEKYNIITNDLMYDYNKTDFNVIKTYQLYRKDSLKELADNISFMKKHNLYFASKLVRGAYYNSEKYQGHLFKNKKDTDKNYNNGIVECLKYKNSYNIIATHNKESIKLGCDLNKNNNIFSFAHLMGMNEKYMDNLKNYNKVYTYIPYGPYKETIPYLTRRLYENLDSIKYIFK